MRALRLIPGLFLLFVSVAGCPTLPAPVPCGQIPSGGCPSGRGGTCDDPTCTSLYDCVDGTWVSVAVCEAPDGGAGGSGSGGGLPDAGPCTPVEIDTTGQKQNCTPDLQDPDCPVEAALGCAEKVCLTGCADFYMCTANGWQAVAYCDEDGGLIVTP
ncbi:Hypothetical protein A7982_04728 [Minicystis rosea]|nr:Hypothetical protein A7982_04728 [Minicystis rosea]